MAFVSFVTLVYGYSDGLILWRKKDILFCLTFLQGSETMTVHKACVDTTGMTVTVEGEGRVNIKVN